MNRIIALTILCTASLAAGVVVASPRSRPRSAATRRTSTILAGCGSTPCPVRRRAARPRGRDRPGDGGQAGEAPPRARLAGHPGPDGRDAARRDHRAGAHDRADDHRADDHEPKPDHPRRPAEIPRFTLRSVDARCFAAPTAPGGWPFAPTTAVHPIRGSFDEPRAPVHIGVDVEAPKDQAPGVRDAGRYRAPRRRPITSTSHATHGRSGTYLQYWHVKLAPGITAGTVVRRRQKLGTVKPGMTARAHLGVRARLRPRRPGPPDRPAGRPVQHRVADRSGPLSASPPGRARSSRSASPSPPPTSPTPPARSRSTPSPAPSTCARA